MSTIKTKITEHLANEVKCVLQSVQGEARKLRDCSALANKSEGYGLDLSVLQEDIAKALKLIELLT